MQRFFALVFMMFLSMTFALNIEAKALETGEKGPPEKIVVYGNEYIVTPFQMPQTSLSWEDVKDFIPPEVLAKPETAYSDGQAFEMLDKTLKEHMKAYDSMVSQYARRIMAANPEMNQDYADYEIAGRFMVNFFAESAPKAQAVYNRYLALLYLKLMLEETLGE